MKKHIEDFNEVILQAIEREQGIADNLNNCALQIVTDFAVLAVYNKTKQDKYTLKDMSQQVFNFYNVENIKTDSRKSAIYNKINCVKWILANEYLMTRIKKDVAEFIHDTEVDPIPEYDLELDYLAKKVISYLAEGFGINGINDLLRKIKEEKKTKEEEKKTADAESDTDTKADAKAESDTDAESTSESVNVNFDSLTIADCVDALICKIKAEKLHQFSQYADIARRIADAFGLEAKITDKTEEPERTAEKLTFAA